MAGLTWEELELPALQWVHLAEPDEAGSVGTGDMRRTDNPSAALPALTENQLDEALRRLDQHGLIRGQRGETSDLVYWMQLWPTADGLRALGEWPPPETTPVNETFAAVLRQLASGMDEEDAGVLRRAGNSLVRIPGGALLDVVKEETKKLGAEIIE
jgi:hypothetical protein